MDWKTFARHGRDIADWGARYHESLRERPVRARTRPGEIFGQLPAEPPETGEDMDTILRDFQDIVMPGITHWQHPRFFAYFPANVAPPSMLAEFLTTVIAPQCMLWQTSPAATEMATGMIRWLRRSLGLPKDFTGAIQDSASTATLAAVLTMRETALHFAGKEKGLFGQTPLRIYCSDEVHSSIDRAIWFSGIGQDNLVRIPTQGPLRGMDVKALRATMVSDLAAGLKPGALSPAPAAPQPALATISTQWRMWRRITASICMSMPPGPDLP